MKRGLLFSLQVFLIAISYGQNKFPTSKGSSVVVDGGNYVSKSPNVSSWARGTIFRNSTGSENIAGIGLFGNSNNASRLYLGIGGTPWTSTNGMTLLANGRVGIGTTAPVAALDIRDLSAFARLILGTGQNSTDSKTALEFRHRYGTSGFANGQIMSSIRSVRTGSSGKGTLIFSTSNNASANASEKMRIQSNGNVGIGTQTPGKYKLAINGKVRAKEVVVETGWSDFVFETDYALRSLDQVEDFIEKNGHLPEIPSAKEVVENGVKLGEMDAKLLMKIEELTLYLIAQQKEMDILKKQLRYANEEH